MKKNLFFILLVLIILSVYTLSEENIIIPDLSIRLRIIPNSNNEKDIYIKEKVKKYLEKNIYDITSNNKNIEEARLTIKENIPNIKNNIDNIFKNNEYDLPYQINFGSNYFPEKKYKGITYEEGYYESLVIKIGEGEGDNWWCVLFPNFCLIDTKGKAQYKSYIKEKITKHKK